MFSSTITTHCWGKVNHPSAGNFSNEVDGDCSWNPERSLCHCSSCEATRESLSLCFTISVCIVFKPRVHLNLSWTETTGRRSCLDWLGNVQRNDSNV